MRKRPDKAQLARGDQEERQDRVVRAEEDAASSKPLLPLRQRQETFE